MDISSMVTMNQLIDKWRSADAVCFDVDSTVCQDEGIDELARHLKCYDRVSNITNTAMSRGLDFQESFRSRLEILKPSKSLIEDFVTRHPPKFTDGIKELITKLQKRNVAVFLVSGGIQLLIHPVADILKIPHQNVFCNKLLFDLEGSYVTFDDKMLTCRSGGKARVLNEIRQRHNFENMIMVGDGMNDFEASSQADLFIGFGGNIVRQNVRLKAPMYVKSFQALIDLLN